MRRQAVRAGRVGHELVKVPLPQVQMVPCADDPDPKVTQRELPPLRQLVRIVEPHRIATVHERDAAGADHLATVAAHDQGGILVDPHAEELAVGRDDDEAGRVDA